MDEAKQSTKEEIKESNRRCWCPHCKRTAWFQDWRGWNWCYIHAIREIRLGETIRSKWFRFRTLKLRNPY